MAAGREIVYPGGRIPPAMARLQEIEERLAAVKAEVGNPPRSAKGAVAVILRGRADVDVLLIERKFLA